MTAFVVIVAAVVWICSLLIVWRAARPKREWRPGDRCFVKVAGRVEPREFVVVDESAGGEFAVVRPLGDAGHPGCLFLEKSALREHK